MKGTPVQLLNMGVDRSCLQPGGPGHMSRGEGRNRAQINGFNWTMTPKAPQSPGEGQASPCPDPNIREKERRAQIPEEWAENPSRDHRKPLGWLLTSPNMSVW